jgi:hypothetical protein
MQKVPPTDNQTPSPTADGPDEPKIWKRAADGIWVHIPSGIYYERPTINGASTYRSLFTKNLDEALKEYYRRRAKGDAAYQKVSATTVGEVILNYDAADCPDRFRQDRPVATRDAEKGYCAKLMEFFATILVALVSIAVFDRYYDFRKKQISKAGCSGNRTVDLELNTLRNAFPWACRCELVAQVPLGGHWPKYTSSKSVHHCREFMPHDAAELHGIARRFFETPRSEVLGWQTLFEGYTALRTVEMLRLRVDAKPYEPGWITPDGKSLCVRRAKGQEAVNPFVKIHEGLVLVMPAWRRWHDDRCPESPWFLPSPFDLLQPVDKGALSHALVRLRKPSKNPDGGILVPFLSHKITSHGLRPWYVTVRRSHGIPDNQIAWEIGHTSRGQTLDEVYGGIPPHWLAGEGPKLQWMPAGAPAWSVLKYATPEPQALDSLGWLAQVPAIGRFHSLASSPHLCVETIVRLLAPSITKASDSCGNWASPAPQRIAACNGGVL